MSESTPPEGSPTPGWAVRPPPPPGAGVGPPAWGSPPGYGPPGYGPPGYGPPGYGPPGYGPPPGAYPGWVPPGTPGPASGKATAAFVLGIIGLVVTLIPAVLALVLSAGVRRSPDQTRSSLAAAGRAKVLGIVGIITSIGLPLLVVGGIVGAADRSATDYRNFQPGQCFNRMPDSSGGLTVKRISCTDPHNAQAVGQITLPGGSWPGPEGFQAEVNDTCEQDARTFLQGSPGDNVEVAFVYPTESDWGNGSRLVLCDLRTIDGSKIVGAFGSGGGTST